MIRVRGIEKVLDAAAPDQESWIAGLEAYEAKKPIEAVLNAAAPTQWQWQDGYEAARFQARIQWAIIAGITIIFGCLIGLALSGAVDGFAWPLMFLTGFIIMFIPAWLASRLIMSLVYN